MLTVCLIKSITNMFTLIFGIFALLFGLFTIYLRLFKDSKGLGKLDRMKKAYGEKAGTIIHIVSYTVLPIVIGILGLVGYFLGIDIF